MKMFLSQDIWSPDGSGNDEDALASRTGKTTMPADIEEDGHHDSDSGGELSGAGGNDDDGNARFNDEESDKDKSRQEAQKSQIGIAAAVQKRHRWSLRSILIALSILLILVVLIIAVPVSVVVSSNNNSTNKTSSSSSSIDNSSAPYFSATNQNPPTATDTFFPDPSDLKPCSSDPTCNSDLAWPEYDNDVDDDDDDDEREDANKGDDDVQPDPEDDEEATYPAAPCTGAGDRFDPACNSDDTPLTTLGPSDIVVVDYWPAGINWSETCSLQQEVVICPDEGWNSECYEQNDAIAQCNVQCFPDSLCTRQLFVQSVVHCVDNCDSVRFYSSAIRCDGERSCDSIWIDECSCCDGVNCPENSHSCMKDVDSFCAVEYMGSPCATYGNPMCKGTNFSHNPLQFQICGSGASWECGNGNRTEDSVLLCREESLSNCDNRIFKDSLITCEEGTCSGDWRPPHNTMIFINSTVLCRLESCHHAHFELCSSVECIDDDDRNCEGATFDRSTVKCGKGSCDQATFKHSVVSCEAGGCESAVFLGCSCCDGIGCSEDAINCDDDSASTPTLSFLCERVFEGQTCAEWGFPLCAPYTTGGSTSTEIDVLSNATCRTFALVNRNNIDAYPPKVFDRCPGVECGSDEQTCRDSSFVRSVVDCTEDGSCKNTLFVASQVTCSAIDSCTDAEMSICSCCDGEGCPINKTSCLVEDLSEFCNNTTYLNQSCSVWGSPLCTNSTARSDDDTAASHRICVNQDYSCKGRDFKPSTGVFCHYYDCAESSFSNSAVECRLESCSKSTMNNSVVGCYDSCERATFDASVVRCGGSDRGSCRKATFKNSVVGCNGSSDGVCDEVQAFNSTVDCYSVVSSCFRSVFDTSVVTCGGGNRSTSGGGEYPCGESTFVNSEVHCLDGADVCKLASFVECSCCEGPSCPPLVPNCTSIACDVDDVDDGVGDGTATTCNAGRRGHPACTSKGNAADGHDDDAAAGSDEDAQDDAVIGV